MIISKLLRRADRTSRFFQPDRRPVRRFMPWADGLEDRISLSDVSVIVIVGDGGSSVFGGVGGRGGSLSSSQASLPPASVAGVAVAASALGVGPS